MFLASDLLRVRIRCAQCRAMPEPKDGERLLADNMESGSYTERPRLRKGIGASMSPFNPSYLPLKQRPEPCGSAPCEIFYHQLPPRSQQPSQSRKERQRVCHVRMRFGAGDQAKGVRWVRPVRFPFTINLRPLHPHLPPILPPLTSLRHHIPPHPV